MPPGGIHGGIKHAVRISLFVSKAGALFGNATGFAFGFLIAYGDYRRAFRPQWDNLTRRDGWGVVGADWMIIVTFTTQDLQIASTVGFLQILELM
jgi:hypothetical protein